MNLKNMLDRLTSNYNKQEGSNVYKLFSIIAPEISFLKELFEKIENWRGIDNAKGKALDNIGEDLRQKRLGLSDEEYRPMLRFKASLNKSNADINSINIAIQSITNDNLIRIYEGYNFLNNNEPASIVVSLKDFNQNIKYEMIDSIIAAGVRAYLRVEKQNESDIYIANTMLYGEKTTIYPYQITEILLKCEINIATGYSLGLEKNTIFPPVSRLDSGLIFDNGFILDD